jgi:hypothetical protein
MEDEYRCINNIDNGVAMGDNKKLKIDVMEFRLQCCISCGADHVVNNVWPYIFCLPILCVPTSTSVMRRTVTAA